MGTMAEFLVTNLECPLISYPINNIQFQVSLVELILILVRMPLPMTLVMESVTTRVVSLAREMLRWHLQQLRLQLQHWQVHPRELATAMKWSQLCVESS